MNEVFTPPHIDRPRSIDGTRRDRRAPGSILGVSTFEGAAVFTSGMPGTTLTRIADDGASGLAVVADPQVIEVLAEAHPSSPSAEDIACVLAVSHTRAVSKQSRPLATVAMAIQSTLPQILVFHHQMAFSPIPRQVNFWGQWPNASWILERWYRYDNPLIEALRLGMLTICGTHDLSSETSVLVTIDNKVTLLGDDQVQALRVAANQEIEHLSDGSDHLHAVASSLFVDHRAASHSEAVIAASRP